MATRSGGERQLETLRRSTLEKNIYHLKAITKVLGNIDISDFDERKLKDYQLHRKDKGRAASTINSEVGTILVLLNWHGNRDGCTVSLLFVNYLSIGYERSYPLPKRSHKSFALMPARLRPSCYCWQLPEARRGEIFNLPWHHVNLDEGTFRIEAHRDFRPKNSKSDRELALPLQVLTALKELPQEATMYSPVENLIAPSTISGKPLQRRCSSLLIEEAAP